MKRKQRDYTKLTKLQALFLSQITPYLPLNTFRIGHLINQYHSQGTIKRLRVLEKRGYLKSEKVAYGNNRHQFIWSLTKE